MAPKITRRSLITNGAIAAAVVAAPLAAPAIAQGRRELRMVTSWPRNFPGPGTSAQRLADRIGAVSDGRLVVTLLSAGEFVPAFEVFDAVALGSADLYHSAEYYFSGKHRAFNLFTAAPFGLAEPEHTAWIRYGGGQELWDELSARFNLKPFLCGNTGPQSAGWFKRELRSLNDTQGMNFRIPGLPGEVWRAIGANVVSMPGGEIFSALNSGALDGADWIGPWNDMALGFHKVAKHYYFPSLLEASAAASLAVNLDLWHGLSTTEQAAIVTATAAENGDMLADFTFNNSRALRNLRENFGITPAVLPEDIVTAMAQAAPDLVASALSDEIGQRIRNSYYASRDEMRAWSSVSAGAYYAARERVLS